MKTAVKPLIFFAAGWVAATLLVANFATAQPDTDSLPAVSGSAADLPSDLPPPATEAAAEAVTGDVTDEKNQSSAKALQQASKKIEDQIRSLQAKPADLNLDDMNKARATLAKLDMLVEMESRLADLEELRQKRNKSMFDAEAIPDSALRPPPTQAVSAFAPSEPPKRRLNYQVSRITGVNGDYVAVLSTGEGKNTVTVRAGDTLDDEMKVTRISAQGVTLYSGQNKSERFLRMSMSGAP